MVDPSTSFEVFIAEVRSLLEGQASEKAYNKTGADGDNELYSFVYNTIGGPGHAIGEIVYKSRRYMAKRDKQDMAKAAAWCYLAWKGEQR